VGAEADPPWVTEEVGGVFRWMWACLERPLAQFDRAAEFWCAVSETDLSSRSGPNQELVTLQPRADADAYLKIQGAFASGGVRIAFDVESVDRAVRIAVHEHHASVVVRVGADFALLRSPGGQSFWLTTWQGSTRRPLVVEHPDGSSSRVDQVTLDISPEHFGWEAEFWSSLTGWQLRGGRTAQFVRLDVPEEMPIHVLLQRRAASGPQGAHIDVACSDVDRVRALHESLGARKVADGEGGWQVMRDPVDAVYCLTPRSPVTGRVSG
jgi:hypothetical protein